MNARDNTFPDSIGGATRLLYRNASDAPKVMRDSPYGGWDSLRDTYRGVGFKGNVATAHGHQFEDAARQLAKEKILGLDLAGPRRVIQGDYAASLDDISVSGETILEIKCPYQGKQSKLWQSVNDYGECGSYYWQMVHQMMVVPSAQTCILFVYDSKSGDYCWTEIDRSNSKEAFLRAEWNKFWDWKDTEDKDPADGWSLIENTAWDQAARQFHKASEEIEAAEERLKEARKTLIQLAEGDKSRGAGITVVKSMRVGSVDYKKIPELKGVNLDSYRGESTEIWTVKESK